MNEPIENTAKNIKERNFEQTDNSNNMAKSILEEMSAMSAKDRLSVFQSMTPGANSGLVENVFISRGNNNEATSISFGDLGGTSNTLRDAANGKQQEKGGVSDQYMFNQLEPEIKPKSVNYPPAPDAKYTREAAGRISRIESGDHKTEIRYNDDGSLRGVIVDGNTKIAQKDKGSWLVDGDLMKEARIDQQTGAITWTNAANQSTTSYADGGFMNTDTKGRPVHFQNAKGGSVDMTWDNTSSAFPKTLDLHGNLSPSPTDATFCRSADPSSSEYTNAYSGEIYKMRFESGTGRFGIGMGDPKSPVGGKLDVIFASGRKQTVGGNPCDFGPLANILYDMTSARHGPPTSRH